jgi:hypothetical protein
MDEVIIPCASLLFFVVLFTFAVVMRYLNYRETLALAERGLVRGDRSRGADGKDTLRWGIIITAVGLALCVGLYPLGLLVGSRFFLGLGPWMLVGLLPTFFGIGLILIYALTRDENGRKTPPPPPASLPDVTAEFRDRPRE